MDGGKKKVKQHITLRLDQLTDMLNKTTCFTGHLTASLQVHITWGRLRILSEKKYLDYLQGRKHIAHSGQSSTNIQQLLSRLSPAELLSKIQKTLAVSGRVQRLISHSQNVRAQLVFMFYSWESATKFGVIK